jgi:hypothetical protein
VGSRLDVEITQNMRYCDRRYRMLILIPNERGFVEWSLVLINAAESERLPDSIQYHPIAFSSVALSLDDIEERKLRQCLHYSGKDYESSCGIESLQVLSRGFQMRFLTAAELLLAILFQRYQFVREKRFLLF